jgi:hypothetical protein
MVTPANGSSLMHPTGDQGEACFDATLPIANLPEKHKSILHRFRAGEETLLETFQLSLPCATLGPR